MATRLKRLTEAVTHAAIERYAEELAAQAPPLTPEMKQELRALLNPPRPRASGTSEPVSPAPRQRAATRQAA